MNDIVLSFEMCHSWTFSPSETKFVAIIIRQDFLIILGETPLMFHNPTRLCRIIIAVVYDNCVLTNQLV